MPTVMKESSMKSQMKSCISCLTWMIRNSNTSVVSIFVMCDYNTKHIIATHDVF